MAEDLPGLREQAECLLRKAEATTGAWHISAEEHSTTVSLADAFSIRLPVAAFRSAEGTSQFLRLVILAMRG